MSRATLVSLCFLAPACLFEGTDDEGDGTPGDGDGDSGGDGDLPGDGDAGDGDAAGVGGGSGGGGGDSSGGGGGESSGGGGGDSSGGGGGDSSGGGGGDSSGGGGGSGGEGDGVGGGSGGVVSGDGDAPNACQVDLQCDVEPLPATGDFGEDCVNRINQFRSCFCDDDGQPLEPLIRWTEAEQCAVANAEYDAGTGEPHSGWPDNACPGDSGPLSREFAGWATNECPGWGSEGQVVSGCLASMYSEGADWAEALGRAPRQADYGNCSGNCYGQYGHFIAMTKASHTHVACGAFEEASGDVWSVQNFK